MGWGNVCRCLLGASTALFVVLASASRLARCSSRRCSDFALGENGRHTWRIVKNYRFLEICVLSRGGRAASKRLGMARKRPRKKVTERPDIDQLSVICRNRGASRSGWSKESHLETQSGSRMIPNVVQVRSARPSGRQKSRRSGRFVPFVPLVSSRLVVWIFPGGWVQ